MTAPVFAAAQCAVRAGDINSNLTLHIEFMRHAREHRVELLVFPELSLTGYQAARAEALVQDIDSPVSLKGFSKGPLQQFLQQWLEGAF